ncbi:formyltransferase family protein [Pararhizobium sp. YC-54]|uniref:methionyl-tRNA formyltransferase n=1 Tax=Pararhizobium sp. YC-54 TaxID=2986920 RepID=UPI0021F7F6C1|nr:formyltransferase family protein [Pararhizobium sp. YC-54]MCV9999556.1 formyltransferase family protein [Pararhizobium sp. YC-54]
MRVVLVGSVESSKVAFDALVNAGKPPVLVVTLPKEAADRHSDFADIGSRAAEMGIPVYYTTLINSPEALKAIESAAPDVTLVIGWSQICKASFRAIARIGSIGFHPAALPLLRGRGVIPWTILLGEKTAGSTLFWLDEGTDSGPILLQENFHVAADETARSLYLKHMHNIEEMVPEAMRLLERGDAPRIGQDHSQASYCAKRTPEDGLIDWRQPAWQILTLIRAVGDPYPGAYTHCNGFKLHIDVAAPAAETPRYIGVTGQVQAHTPSGFVIMCGDGRCIEARHWRSQNGKPPPVHSKLVSLP